MGEIYIKLKDKTSTYWLAEQGVSLIGEIPKRVVKTAFVSKLLKNGVAETVSDEFAKKYLLSDEEKTKAFQYKEDESKFKDQIEVIANKIKSGELTLAKQLIEKAKIDLMSFGPQFIDENGHLLTDVKLQLKDKKDSVDKELGEIEQIKSLIEGAIQAKIIVLNSNGYSIDGKVVAETEDSIVNYLLKSKKNRTEIETKVNDYVKHTEAGASKGNSETKNPAKGKK